MNFSQRKMLVALAALASATPAISQSPINKDTFSCLVSQQGPEGRWRAARDIDVIDGTATAGRDTYEWETGKVIEFGPGMKLNWQIVYYWPANIGRQKNIPETEIMVDTHFSFEAQNEAVLKKPERSWLHFYRSAATGKARHPLATSLSTMTLWHQYGARSLSTRAIIHLDDLLAFGSGRDQLEWEIRSAPGDYGQTALLAKGHLPIAAMRKAAADILKLRSSLDRQAANFRNRCQILPVVPVTVGP